MSQSPPLPPALAEELARWREAWQLRRAYPRWVVSWAADVGQYRAYRRARVRRDTILAAATPADLATQIEHAEQAEPARTAQPPA